jgi:hypothetical protein
LNLKNFVQHRLVFYEDTTNGSSQVRVRDGKLIRNGWDEALGAATLLFLAIEEETGSEIIALRKIFRYALGDC